MTHHIIVVPPAGYTTTVTQQDIFIQNEEDLITANDFVLTRQGGPPPTSTITYPGTVIHSIYNWVGSISGTATAELGSGDLARVLVTVQDQTTGLYWDGNSFLSSTPIRLVASGSSAWFLPLPAAALVAGHVYEVQSVAEHQGDVQQDSPTTQDFTILTPVTFNSLALPPGVMNGPYSQTLTAGGGSGTGYSFTTSSNLDGLTLSTGGRLSGTPTAAGSFPITVFVADSFGDTDSQTYILNVALATPPVLQFAAASTTVDESSGTAQITIARRHCAGARSPSTWRPPAARRPLGQLPPDRPGRDLRRRPDQPGRHGADPRRPAGHARPRRRPGAHAPGRGDPRESRDRQPGHPQHRFDPAPTPTPPRPPRPVVVGTVVSLQTTKIGRRKTAVLTIEFSGALDAASAQNLAAYRLVTAGRDKKFGTKDDKVIRLASASYNAIHMPSAHAPYRPAEGSNAPAPGLLIRPAQLHGPAH